MFLMIDRMGFAYWLQGEREKAGISQSDLARLSGLNRAVINKIEMGTKPMPETLQAIARALRLPIEEVYIAAKLLPPKSESTLLSNRLNEEIKDWSDDEVAELLLIARAKSEHRNRGHNEAKAAAGRNI